MRLSVIISGAVSVDAMTRPGRSPHVVELTADELDGFVIGGPTADDVSFTYDGRQLDTKEKVLAFLAELESAAVVTPHGGVD